MDEKLSAPKLHKLAAASNIFNKRNFTAFAKNGILSRRFFEKKCTTATVASFSPAVTVMVTLLFSLFKVVSDFIPSDWPTDTVRD